MPYYYKHAMWLDKNEWGRLKSQANPPPTLRVEEDPYIKDLIEKSQKWIRTWPDSVEGHVERVQKRVDKDHNKEMVEMKAMIKQRKHDDSRQALAKARQLIFEGSSYGKQLLSALLASKVIEEREAQIAFKREIAKDQQELDKKRNHEELYFLKTDQNEQKLRKKKNVLFAQENKYMYESHSAKIKRDKEDEARLEREDAILMQGLLDYEKREEKKYIKCQVDQIKKYEKDLQEFREAKIKREIENDEKIKKAKQENDRRLLKIKTLQEKYNKGKFESEATKLNYQLIEKIENEKRKRFEEFVEKGIKRHEDAIIKKDQEELTRQKNRNETKNSPRKQQDAMEEWKQSHCSQNQNIYASDRQCVLARSLGERRPIQHKLLSQPKSVEKKLQFLSPPKKQIDELRLREKEPTPWSGLSGAHAQFAEQAARTLGECKHKTMARKVVDEYRKLNYLDATTLPVKNY